MKIRYTPFSERMVIDQPVKGMDFANDMIQTYFMMSLRYRECYYKQRPQGNTVYFMNYHVQASHLLSVYTARSLQTHSTPDDYYIIPFLPAHSVPASSSLQPVAPVRMPSGLFLYYCLQNAFPGHSSYNKTAQNVLFVPSMFLRISEDQFQQWLFHTYRIEISG